MGHGWIFWTPQKKSLFLQTKEMKEFRFGVEAGVKQGECSVGWATLGEECRASKDSEDGRMF